MRATQACTNVHSRIWRAAFCLAMLALGYVTASGQVPAKKRVAVLDFANAAVQSGVSGPYLQTDAPELGKGISELLISKIVQDGSVSVIERTAIDKVLAEQNLTNSDRADPQTAAKLGRVLGADVIVLGTITRYDYDAKMKGHVGNRRGNRRSGTTPQAKYDVTAKVQISSRLVSPDSGEVVAVMEGAGETDRKGIVMDVRDTSGRVMQAVGLNNPVLNESIDKAITQLAGQLEPALAKLPARAPVIEAVVADVNDSGQLVLNVGAERGVKVGDRFQVLRPGNEVQDPATGKVLMRNDTLLGDAVVTTVNDVSSTAKYQGTKPAKVRDVAKSIPRQP